MDLFPLSQLIVFILCFTLASPAAFAAEAKTTIDLPTVKVDAESSFDTLSDESYAPKQEVKFENDRPGTIDALSKSLPYPTKTYGYPSGATGVSLGGRTADDTQISTLGVPLSAAQGGGADLSIFPSYLWSGALISPSISLSGFSPQAASGSLELKLYTREWLKQNNRADFGARLTTSYDRTLQTYSLGTKTENLAAVVGMSTGGLEGPAGSVSFNLIRSREHSLAFHFIGSDQEGPSPGSNQFSTPNSRKKSWHIIPVLESHQEFFEAEQKLIVESTFYGDLQSLTITDPNPIFSSDQRTQQYGVENALLYGPYTLALSARYTRFTQADHGTYVEWPLMGTLLRDFDLVDQWSLKLLGGLIYLAHPSLPNSNGEYQARISVKKNLSEKNYFFGELGSKPKMPTLIARYYIDPFFTANPNLKVERIYTAVGGYRGQIDSVETTTTLKAEARKDTQINAVLPNFNYITINAGSAYLVSLNQEFGVSFSPNWNLKTSTLFTHSQLADTHYSYPDLPALTQQARLEFIPFDGLHFNFNARYLGPSTTSSGTFHEPYALQDFWVSYSPLHEIEVTAGVDNLWDKRAEPIPTYPLPGRIFYASGRVVF